MTEPEDNSGGNARGLRGIADVLRLPHYGPFVLSRTCASIGVWMERLATGWLAWDLTQSTAWLGAIAFIRLVPALFLGLVGGAWSDRTTPMRVLRATKVAIIATNVSMLALLAAGMVTIEVLALVSLAIGSLQAVSNPAAGAIVWNLVPRVSLNVAISLNSLTFHVATFIGPALAGVMIATSGPGLVYGVAAAGQAVLLFVLFRIPADIRANGAASIGRGQSLWADMLDGIRYVRAERAVFAILFIHFVFALSAQPLIDLMPAIAALFFDGGADLVGLMTASLGAGAIIGGFWLAAFSRLTALRHIVGSALLTLMTLIVVLAINRNLPIAFILLAAIGACLIIRASGLQTLLQLTVTDEMRGRAMGFYGLLVRTGSAFGALAIGFASEIIGLSWAIALSAVTGAATLIVFGWRYRAVWRSVRVR